MVDIVIHNPSGETIIRNVHRNDLDFWEDLLEDAFEQGNASIVDLKPDKHRVA